MNLAVFDIDGTLFRSSLLIELMKGLVENNIFPNKSQNEINTEYMAWANREGSYGEYLGKVIKVYEKYIAGCSEESVERTVEQVLKREEKKLYRYTRKLIKDLKKEKYFLFAISGSPGHILTSFAKDMGFDKYLGGYYEVVDGEFTGKQPFGNPSYDKKKTLTDFLGKSPEKFDLKNSIGVGDTESDISFLEMMGSPIAFNPNRKLAEHARKKGWRIVVERKDVIYQINDFSILKAH